MVAFITGITGQNGYYLARHLHQLGAEVWGTSRAAILPQELNFARLVPITDYTDQKRLERAIAAAKPTRSTTSPRSHRLPPHGKTRWQPSTSRDWGPSGCSEPYGASPQRPESSLHPRARSLAIRSAR